MDEWREITLGDFASLQRGHDLPDSARHPGNVPVMGSFGVTGRHSEARATAPGVTIGRSGASIGMISYIDRDYWPLNTCLYVTDFHGNNPRFVYYFLRTLDLARYNSGSAQPSLNRNFIHPMHITVPDRSEQDTICELLGALDDKIDLNRRMNETLEVMARALFKDWFVDFGPTRAKMEGREPYLASEIWALFPDRLDAEGKPEGWRDSQLAEVVQFNPSEPLRKGEPAPYLDMASVPTQGAVPDLPVIREFGSGTRFRNGDTLFARITPCLENGKTAFVQCLDNKAIGWGSTEFIVMRSSPPVPKPYTYIVARDPDFRRHAIQSMTGTSGRQRAQQDVVAAYGITTPASPVLWEAFGTIIDSLFSRIAANAHEIHTLADLRDLLLPKLMSGEIRIRDAEKMAGEMT